MNIRAFLSVFLVFVTSVSVSSQDDRNKIEIIRPASYRAPTMTPSDELQGVLNKAIADVLTRFEAKGVKAEEIAATVIDVRDGNVWKSAEVRGNERIYPASVVKMFFMAALARQIEDGKVVPSPELKRGLRDMIVDSSNEATQYVLDVLTDTSSGAELPKSQFEAWQHKRNRVNRFFTSMGYQNINVNQKTFCEDAYGIEQQSRNYRGENRNMLTTDATARLLAEIVSNRIARQSYTAEMMQLMKRDPFSPSKDPDSQAHGFSGKALIDKKLKDVKLWSKAGWTSKTRHDAAYFEFPDGRKFVIAVFTENHANIGDIIPAIVGNVIEGMPKPAKLQ